MTRSIIIHQAKHSRMARRCIHRYIYSSDTEVQKIKNENKELRDRLEKFQYQTVPSRKAELSTQALSSGMSVHNLIQYII